jgi:hypothetical protein
MSIITDRNDPRLHQVKENGQNEAYIVLSEEERNKGFVRPVRDSYVHVGKKIENTFVEFIPVEIYSPDDKHFNRENGFVYFGKYHESESPLVGRYLKETEYNALIEHKIHVGGCGTLTRMNSTIAETYARDPKFYGATFCVGCRKHLPVNEFVWDGTNIIVGS